MQRLHKQYCRSPGSVATKGKANNAITRLEETIVWKRTLGMWDIQAVAEEVAPEVRSTAWSVV